jgi:hypothetical protein
MHEAERSCFETVLSVKSVVKESDQAMLSADLTTDRTDGHGWKPKAERLKL